MYKMFNFLGLTIYVYADYSHLFPEIIGTDWIPRKHTELDT